MKIARDDKHIKIQKLTYSALYLALAMVLPFLTGQIPEIGKMLCPMHIPALLCGFICGWPWGLTVGFVSPILRSVLFGMPSLYPTAVAMSFELCAYGAAAGLLSELLPSFRGRLYTILVASMVFGRLIWGMIQYMLAGLSHTAFSFKMFLAGAVTEAVPGIILQLVLIPVIVSLMTKAGLSLVHTQASGRHPEK